MLAGKVKMKPEWFAPRIGHSNDLFSNGANSIELERMVKAQIYIYVTY